eukprot:c1087_g1_i1 orf=51-563(+)
MQCMALRVTVAQCLRNGNFSRQESFPRVGREALSSTSGSEPFPQPQAQSKEFFTVRRSSPFLNLKHRARSSSLCEACLPSSSLSTAQAQVACETDLSGTNSSACHKFPLDDVIEAQQFDRTLLERIFDVAHLMEDLERGSDAQDVLKGYLMATLFYEPSTRTRLSFESAM